ncbi:MAG: hypothetical protein ABIP97_05885, partial [Chthoniobacterales bacterium]
LIFKNHDELSDVDYFQTQSLRIWSEQAVPFELDGELAGNLPVKFHFSEQRLKVFVPSPTEANSTGKNEIHVP